MYGGTLTARIADRVAMGLLMKMFPVEVIDQAIVDCGRTEQRRRLMPSRLTAYFVLGLALFPEKAYTEVFDLVAADLAGLSGQIDATPSRAALSKARERLGWQVMERLFGVMARPFGPPQDVAGRRVVLLEVDEVEVVERTRNTASDRLNQGAAQQTMIVARLVESVTNTAFAASVMMTSQPVAAATPLFGQMDDSMLVLGPPELFTYAHLLRAKAAAVPMVWQLPATMSFRRQDRLADGSYIVSLAPNRSDSGREELTVRLIEAGQDRVTAQPKQLVTTIEQPGILSAEELIQLYNCRWVKRSNRYVGVPELGRRQTWTALRSRTPELIRQEVMAQMCIQYAIGWQMAALDTPFLAQTVR